MSQAGKGDLEVEFVTPAQEVNSAVLTFVNIALQQRPWHAACEDYMHWPAIAGEDAGQDTVEYSLILALVAVIAAAMLPFSTAAIASICAKTEDHLQRALAACL